MYNFYLTNSFQGPDVPSQKEGSLFLGRRCHDTQSIILYFVVLAGNRVTVHEHCECSCLMLLSYSMVRAAVVFLAIYSVGSDFDECLSVVFYR